MSSRIEKLNAIRENITHIRAVFEKIQHSGAEKKTRTVKDERKENFMKIERKRFNAEFYEKTKQSASYTAITTKMNAEWDKMDEAARNKYSNAGKKVTAKTEVNDSTGDFEIKYED